MSDDMTLPTILVVDDEIRSQESIRRTLDEEFEVLTASSAEEALEVMSREWVQVVLCDQRMPGMSGVEFLKTLRESWPETVRIIISGYTETSDIIDGINDAGIYQFVLKPWQPENLLLTVRSAARVNALQLQNQQLHLEMRTAEPVLQKVVASSRLEIQSRFHFDRLTRASDSPLNPVLDMARQVAPFDLSLLLTGESGTGKELLARAVHYASSRADKAFVVENCGALPDQLLESELFGYKRGAFTGAYEDRVGLFQQADGGTIFLDEIGETSPAFQVKLLRVLQEGEIRPLGAPRSRRVNVRVIAATNRDLEEEVRAGRFREDLFYRLATITLQLLPLRDRPGDIPPVAREILKRASKQLGKAVDGFSEETMSCLKAYRWPGNVRELENEILRMLALAPDGRLCADLLSPRVLYAAAEEEEREIGFLARLNGTLKERLDALEARVLKEALIRHRWNKTRAADELGLSRVGLRNKLQRYGLDGSGADETESLEIAVHDEPGSC